MQAGTVNIKLMADIMDLQAKMQQAERMVTRAVGNINSQFSTLAGGIAAGVGISGITKLVDEYAKYTAQLKLASITNAEYVASLNSVRSIAAASHADLAATGVLYARIANGTRELGIGQQQVANITESVNLSLKVSGATTAESASAMLQLSQAFASGTLRGEEFNAVNEAAPRLMKALAEGMGVPVGALKEMASNGLITSSVMASVLPKALADLREESKSIQTISGAFVVLKNNALEFVGVQAQSSGVVSVISGAVMLLAENLGVLAGVVGTILAVKLVGWLEGMALQAYSSVAANSALIASNLSVAQANVSAAATEEFLAAARVSELRATVLASEGSVALAITTNGLIPAQARAAVAAEAHTAALAALTIAQRATSIAGTAASGVMALLGGPIGLITMLLGLGVTAWMAWGESSKDASNKASVSVEQSTGEILSNLEKQNVKLRERLVLMNSGIPEIAKESSPAVERMASKLTKINELKAKGNKLTGSEEIALIELQGTFNDLQKGINEQTSLKSALEAGGKASTDLIEVRQRLAGVNHQYLDDLKKYQAALKAGAISEKDYIAEVSKLAVHVYKKSEAGKEAAKVDQASAKEAKSAAREYESQAKSYADLIASISEKIAANKQELDSGKKLTESEKQALDIQKMVEKGKISAADASSKKTKKLLQELEVSEKLKIAAETYIANEKAIRDAGESDLKSISEQVEKQREHNAEIGKTKEQIELAREAKVNAATASLQLESNAITALLTQADLAGVLTEKDKELYAQRLGYLDRIIGKRQEDANLLRQGAELEKQATVNAEQLKMLQDVEGTAKSVFMDVATHGTDAFKKIGQTLKASVIDALYQLTVKKFVVNVVGSMTGASAETMALAAGGGSSGALSSASNAYSLYGAASGYSGTVNAAAGMMGAGATAGSSALALGYGNAVGAMGGDALGAMIAGNASWAGVAAEGGTAIAVAAETGAAAIAAAAEGGAAAIAGASAGSAAAAAGPLAAIGPVGWTALAAVAAISIFGGNKGNPTSSTGDSNIKFDALGNETSRLDMATVTAFKAVASTEADDIVRGVQAQYAAAAKALGATVADSAFAYSGNTGKDGKEPQFALRGGVGSSYYGGGDVAATPEALKLETSRVILAALQGSELPKYLSGMFDGLSAASLNQSQIDQIMSTATAYTAFHAQLDAMPFENLKDLSYDTAASLIAAAGGMDALNTNLGAYYSNFYSAEEKRGQTIKNINLATEGSGLNAATATAESFRALVDAQDVTTESGRKTYTQLLSVSSAFYSLGDNLRKLQDDTANLQIELMRAQGNKSGADSAQYILDTKGMGEAERAVFNYNASIKNQATALTERFDLEDKLRAAQEESMRRSGDVAGADAMQIDILSRSRAIERDKLDESNRAIYDRIIQLEDEKSASEKSAAAQKDLNSKIRQAAKDNIDLAMTNLDKAKKSTSDALAALEKSIAAEKTRVTVIRDAAAESVKTITGIFDLLKTQTTELYNSVSSTAAMQAAQGNAFIDNALNNAQKTGYLPDQKQLAEAISAARGGLSSTQYATQFEADQAALITAGKLSQLQEISGTQLTTAEKSLNAAEEQLRALDAALEYQKAQVDALNGVNVGILSIADAVNALASAMTAQKAAQAAVDVAQAQGAASLYASNPDAVKAPGKTGLDFWQGQIAANGYDATATKFDSAVGSITGDIKGWYSANPNAVKNPAAADVQYWAGEVDYMGQAAAKDKFDKTVAAMTGTALPSYAVGANYIPHDQIAQLHEGEAVVPKAYNPAAGGVGGGNTERLESLVEALTAEVMRLQGLVAEGNDYGRRTSTAVNGNPDQPILVQTV